MRTISSEYVRAAVRRLCIQANIRIPEDVRACLAACRERETFPVAQNVLDQMLENHDVALQENIPICQDTGMACVFVTLGQDVHVDGDLEAAIQNGVRDGYREGYLRKSVVRDPLDRVNTGDNTPAIITWDVVPGDVFRLTVAPKGFGSENMSRLAMLKPSDGLEGVKRFILETVRLAGPNPCPPVVVGVGLGGTFDRVALLAKRALLRPLDSHHADPFYAKLEKTLLDEINALGIGPQGFGGATTALGVLIETCPTHIAGLPVAVNINCHVTRHATEVL